MVQPLINFLQFHQYTEIQGNLLCALLLCSYLLLRIVIQQRKTPRISSTTTRIKDTGEPGPNQKPKGMGPIKIKPPPLTLPVTDKSVDTIIKSIPTKMMANPTRKSRETQSILDKCRVT